MAASSIPVIDGMPHKCVRTGSHNAMPLFQCDPRTPILTEGVPRPDSNHNSCPSQRDATPANLIFIGKKPHPQHSDAQPSRKQESKRQHYRDDRSQPQRRAFHHLGALHLQPRDHPIRREHIPRNQLDLPPRQGFHSDLRCAADFGTAALEAAGLSGTVLGPASLASRRRCRIHSHSVSIFFRMCATISPPNLPSSRLA